jgi:two-component system NtrC family sensor kinase
VHPLSPYVLFVDDDDANLVVWQTACSERFNVLTASSGVKALELMREHPVAVVIADQRMPAMTGVELLERVRDEFPHAIRLLITAYSDLGAAIDAINRGNVRRYLRKPCALAELLSEVGDALDLYELRRRVQAMERRLVLTERVYALGLVASGIGRELERPAGWIRESVTLARTELHQLAERLGAQGVDVQVLRTRLSELEEGLSRALHGVERVVEIARSVGMPSEKAGEQTELTEVIRVALRVVRGELRRRAEVELDLEPVPLVSGSAAKLGQVVLNLLVNALDAVVSLPPTDRVITLRLRAESRSVRFEVLDRGAQIPAEDLPHVFDPFHSSRSPRGIGLGLAISKAIAEELGGRLDVANRTGGGVYFKLLLPAIRRADGGPDSR